MLVRRCTGNRHFTGSDIIRSQSQGEKFLNTPPPCSVIDEKKVFFSIKSTLRPPNEPIFYTAGLQGISGQALPSIWAWLNFGLPSGRVEVAPWWSVNVIPMSSCYLVQDGKSDFKPFSAGIRLLTLSKHQSCSRSVIWWESRVHGSICGPFSLFWPYKFQGENSTRPLRHPRSVGQNGGIIKSTPKHVPHYRGVGLYAIWGHSEVGKSI